MVARKREVPARTIVLALCALLLVGSGSSATELKVVRNARLYTGPSSTTTRIRVLHPPETVTRLLAGTTNDYISVRTRQNEVGWVYRRLVAEVPPSAGAAAGATPTSAFDDLPPLTGDQMRVHFINVGQGDATLLEFPCGVALVDTGGERSPENVDDPDFDSVPVLRSYLDGFFSSRPDLERVFDLLALTHPHIDHTRGVEMVSSTYSLTNVIDNGQRKNTLGGRPQIDLEDWLAENTETMHYLGIRESDIVSDQGLADEIVDPIGPCDGSATDPTIRALWGQVDTSAPGANNANNNSVVLRVDFGQFSLLLTGDLEEQSIERFLNKYQANPSILDVDVYQVGHHGSRNATTRPLVDAMSPALAVFSMGPFERDLGRFIARQFGHPNRQALEPLEAAVTCSRTPVRQQIGLQGAFGRNPSEFEERTISAGLFATGWDGNVVLTADADGSFEIWTERSGFEVGLICSP